MALGAKANWSSAARGLQDLGSGLNSKLSPRRFGDSEASFQMGDGTEMERQSSLCAAHNMLRTASFLLTHLPPRYRGLLAEANSATST